MLNIFGKDSRLLDPNEMREHSAGRIGNMDMYNYYVKTDQLNDFFSDAFFFPGCKNVGCYKYIELGKPVVHPFFFKEKTNVLSWLLDLNSADLKGLIYCEEQLLLEPIRCYEKNTIIRDTDYYRLTEDGYTPKVCTGAEAIRCLLDVDWNDIVRDLREQVEYRSPTVGKRLNKRISIIESFLSIGSNPRWIVLDALPVPQVDYLFKNASETVRQDIKLLYINVAYQNERVYSLEGFNLTDVQFRCECLKLQMAIDALFKNSANCYTYKSSRIYNLTYFRNDGPRSDYPMAHADGSRLKSLDTFTRDESFVENSFLLSTALGFDATNNSTTRNKYYAFLDCERDAALKDFEMWYQTERKLQKEAAAIENWDDEEEYDFTNLEVSGPDEYIFHGDQTVRLENVNTDDEALYMNLYYETDDDEITMSAEDITLDNKLIDKPNIAFCDKYDFIGAVDIRLCDLWSDTYDISFVVRVYNADDLIREVSVKAIVDLYSQCINMKITENSILTVSLRMILAYRDRYFASNIVIAETVVMLKNDVLRKDLTVGILNSGSRLDKIDYDNLIEVFYNDLPDVDDFIMMSANLQKLKVRGVVCKYDNSYNVKPCISATKIRIL